MIMDEVTNKRKFNAESVSPEANQAKKYQGDVSLENRSDAFASLPGDHCPYCEKVCLPESRSIQCDLCGVWVHALCVNISAGLYGKLTVVCEIIIATHT